MLWLKLLVYGPVFLGATVVVGPWWALHLGGGATLPASTWSLAVGAALILAGAVVAAWCTWDFGHVGRGTPAPFDAPTQHVTVGLYRNVRNPMYVGMLLVLFGEAVAYLSVWLLGYTLAMCLCLHLFVVLYEEQALRRKFGDSYREYCASVPRWLPRGRQGATA